MGITISYGLKFGRKNPMKMLQKLREQALNLPFQSVSEIEVLEGDMGGYARYTESMLLYRTDDHRNPTPVKCSFTVEPTKVVLFYINVGEGCETMTVGFAEYPEYITRDDYSIKPYRGYRSHQPSVKIKTKNHKNSWSRFCKTQFAMLEQHGGAQNFIKCHLSIIALLDYAKSLGIVDYVDDEGGYWDTRDIKLLAQRTYELGAVIAGATEALRRVYSGVESPITSDSNYLVLAEEGRLNSEAIRKLSEALA